VFVGSSALAVIIAVEVVTVITTIAVNARRGERPTRRLLAYMALAGVLGWIFARVAGA
jgi:hypothetical protein